MKFTKDKCPLSHDDECCPKCGKKLDSVWIEGPVPDGRTVKVLAAPCCEIVHVLCVEQVSYPHQLS